MRLLPTLTIVLTLWSTVVRAELPADARAVADAAYDGVVALAKKTRAKGTMPQWSDPAGHAALAKMWDAPAILGTPPYSAKDVPALLAIIPKEGAVLKSYILFSDKPGTPPDFAANSQKYEDEIARASAFMIRLNTAELPAITDFMTHLRPDQLTQARLDGLRQMRLGMLQEVTGATMIIRGGGLKPENKAVILAALTDGADALAAASSPADRETIIKTVEPTIALLAADEKAQMESFVRAMRRTDCTGLCALK